MNRRTMGRVKQARKRLQKRIDIRAGRRISMQQFLHNTHSQDEPEMAVETPVVVESTGTHELVMLDPNHDFGDTDVQVLARGTEYAMRKQKREEEELLLNGGNPVQFKVRKVKVAA
jgi:ABC-type tungstate transport system permease subunit